MKRKLRKATPVPNFVYLLKDNKDILNFQENHKTQRIPQEKT